MQYIPLTMSYQLICESTTGCTAVAGERMLLTNVSLCVPGWCQSWCNSARKQSVNRYLSRSNYQPRLSHSLLQWAFFFKDLLYEDRYSFQTASNEWMMSLTVNREQYKSNLYVIYCISIEMAYVDEFQVKCSVRFKERSTLMLKDHYMANFCKLLLLQAQLPVWHMTTFTPNIKIQSLSGRPICKRKIHISALWLVCD